MTIFLVCITHDARSLKPEQQAVTKSFRCQPTHITACYGETSDGPNPMVCLSRAILSQPLSVDPGTRSTRQENVPWDRPRVGKFFIDILLKMLYRLSMPSALSVNSPDGTSDAIQSTRGRSVHIYSVRWRRSPNPMTSVTLIFLSTFSWYIFFRLSQVDGSIGFPARFGGCCRSFS